MTAAQRSQLRKALLELAKQAAGTGPKRIEPNRTSDEAVGEDADIQPLNEMHQVIASNRNRNLAELQSRIEAALAKLRDAPEDFGMCEECGEEIPFARLKAMPYAELCVTCQGKRDGPRGLPTRRKVTDYT